MLTEDNALSTAWLNASACVCVGNLVHAV